MSANKNTVTPADATAEEKLVKPTLPAQNEGEKTNTDTQDDVKGTDQVEKKTLKQRVAAMNELLKKNNKVVIAVGLAVGAATIALVKYTKQQAEKAVYEQMSAEDETELKQAKADAESIADMG